MRILLRRLHRALAVVVALCLMTFQLEALIADVCDGDATPAEIAALVGPASDLPRDAAQVASSRAATNDLVTPAVPARNGHGVHTCHCVHAHGGVLPRIEPVVVHVVDVATMPPLGRPLAAYDVARVPLPRPPLA